MDVRQIDEAEPLVSLDLLRAWISTAHRRKVGETSPPGCPWSSLVLALQHAGFDGSFEDLERQLRQHLVDTYLSQSKEGVEATIRAKLAYGGAFMQLVAPALKSRPRWTWYILCLTIATFDPLDQGSVRVPLDMVDLQVLAIRFKVSIFVSQLLSRALQFKPSGDTATCSIHLVHHRGLWAPVLGLKPPENEEGRLVNAVVELHSEILGDKPESLPRGSTARAGCVVDYSRDKDEYLVDLGGHRVSADRSHISRVLYSMRQEDRKLGGLADKETSGLDTRLSGIPEKSLEWQLLHELVRREARFKLEHMMQQLAGREAVHPADCRPTASSSFASRGKDPVPQETWGAPTPSPGGFGYGADDGGGWGQGQPENPQDAASQRLPLDLFDPGPVVGGRLAFDFMVEVVRDNCEISVYVVRAFAPTQRGYLPLSVGDEVQIIEVGDRWIYAERLASGCPLPLVSRAAEGWCPRDCLTIWEARQQFRPNDRCERGRFLALEARDTVVLTRRYEGEWDGWAHGVRWGEKMGSGMFNLSHVEPQVLVRKWTWEL